jgi:hypothetical protein
MALAKVRRSIAGLPHLRAEHRLRNRDAEGRRLTTSSNFVGCSTGGSASLAPLRILPTQVAALRTTALSGRDD